MFEPNPVHPGVLISIADVSIEASPADREAMLWFYGTPAGLRISASADAPDDTGKLQFRSDQHTLIVSLVDSPKIDSNPYRVVIAVSSLDQTGVALDERKVAYDRLHGIYHTEEYISVLDSAGNRVRFQRAWPATF